MIIGGLISILIAIWIYKTAVETKTGNKIYWVVGSVVLYLVVQVAMIYSNMIIFDFVLLPLVVPFFVVAVIRQLVMLRQTFSFMGLFSGIKGVFISIKNSFAAALKQ